MRKAGDSRIIAQQTNNTQPKNSPVTFVRRVGLMVSALHSRTGEPGSNLDDDIIDQPVTSLDKMLVHRRLGQSRNLSWSMN